MEHELRANGSELPSRHYYFIRNPGEKDKYRTLGTLRNLPRTWENSEDYNVGYTKFKMLIDY